MAQTNINIRMDKELKEAFSAFCEDMGMSMSTAVNIFAKKAVREYRIPFEISGEKPNTETLQAMHNVVHNENLSRSFSSVEELMEDLYAED